MFICRDQSLTREDPLETGMATHSSFLAWRIPWTEEPGGLQSMGHKESDTTERLILLLCLCAVGPRRILNPQGVTKQSLIPLHLEGEVSGGIKM